MRKSKIHRMLLLYREVEKTKQGMQYGKVKDKKRYQLFCLFHTNLYLCPESRGEIRHVETFFCAKQTTKNLLMQRTMFQ